MWIGHEKGGGARKKRGERARRGGEERGKREAEARKRETKKRELAWSTVDPLTEAQRVR